MQLFWTAVFLILCQTIEERECQIVTEDAADILNRTEYYGEPIDFRCFGSALKYDFNFAGEFITIGYAIVIDDANKKLGCTGYAKQYYPRLTGTDPMMPYYINTLSQGLIIATETKAFVRRKTPPQRRKTYCSRMQLIAEAFPEYWEKFHSESDLCAKMMEFIKICHQYRQMKDLFAAKLLEKLCFDEDGCYSVMKLYDDDLPYCVKTTAIIEFKNSSVGSWHHTIINYCKLTEMVPEAKVEKYDRSILTQKGRTKENLREMCLYLRYRLLPEEGKEQEIPDDAAEDDTFDTETTTGTEYQNGVSVLDTTLYCSVFYTLVNT